MTLERKMLTPFLTLLAVLASISLSSCLLPPSSFTTRKALTGPAITPEGRWNDVELNVYDWLQKKALSDDKNPAPPIAEVFSMRWLLERFSPDKAMKAYSTDPREYPLQLDANAKRIRENHQEDIRRLSEEWTRELQVLLEAGSFFSKPSKIKYQYLTDKGVPNGPNRASLEVEYLHRESEKSTSFTMEFVLEYEAWHIDAISIDPLKMSSLMMKDE